MGNKLGRKLKAPAAQKPEQILSPKREAAAAAPCPACNGPRAADDSDRLCPKCRQRGPAEIGSLLEAKTRLESGGLLDVADDFSRPNWGTWDDEAVAGWGRLRHFGRKCLGEFVSDADLIRRLLDWLAAVQCKPHYVALFMQRNEVTELLEAACEPSKAPSKNESLRAPNPKPRAAGPSVKTKPIRKSGKVSDRDKQAALEAIQRDMDALKHGRSVSRDPDARAAMLRKNHAALVRLYNVLLPPPELPADVSESVAYLRMLQRFLKPAIEPRAAAKSANQGVWAYQQYYRDQTGVEFRLALISTAAKHLADMIRKRCPIIGQDFPFDRRDSRAQADVVKAADTLWTLLDYSKSIPPKMALHINALDCYGHPQRAAVVPLFRLWRTYHDDVAPAIAEANAASPFWTLAVFEPRTVDALERAAAELDELTAAEIIEQPNDGAERQATRETAAKAREVDGKKKKRAKRGRPPDTDPDKDRQIAEAWDTRQYRTYAELERELNQAHGNVRRAIERHRKRERLARE